MAKNILPVTNELDELRAKVASLQAANEALAKTKGAALRLKVSEKGAVSLYGMGRFPVSLYGSQWERLLDHADMIREFLKANASSLATKDAPKPVSTVPSVKPAYTPSFASQTPTNGR